MSFIVSLPKYSYQQPFNTSEFTSAFPNSLLTLALQSGEKVIELENPLVTPEVLQLIQSAMTTGRYPYIDENTGRALDYLGIDFPEFVYDPRYRDFLSTFPNPDWNADYYSILQYAVDHNFLGLAQYLFSITNSAEHKEDDTKMIQYILRLNPYIPPTDEREGILSTLLQNPNISIDPKSIYQSVANHGYINILKYLNDVAPSADYVVYLPYVVRWIGYHPENFNNLADTIFYLGDLLQSITA